MYFHRETTNYFKAYACLQAAHISNKYFHPSTIISVYTMVLMLLGLFDGVGVKSFQSTEA
jgi:hypothetical protein